MQPQKGSEGTEIRSDFFHSSLKYIFNSQFGRVKIKELFVARCAFIRPEFFLKVSCVFIFLLHELIENLSKMSEILKLHPQIGSEGTEFRSDFFH